VNLAGKRILVTRPHDQAQEFVAELERRGAQTILLPAIRILPPAEWEECDRSIRDLSSFDAVVFTSANAVEYFCGRCAEQSPDLWRGSLRITYVVGEKTAQALERWGVAVAHRPDRHSGRGLLNTLPADTLRGKTFLLPRGDRAREEVADGLTSAGGRVTTVTVYRTGGPSEETVAEMRRVLEAGLIDVVSFFSPSAVHHFVDAVGEGIRRRLGGEILTAVIGDTTRAALTDRGIPVSITAPRATGVAMAESIERYFAEGIVPA
jgi:uroporphyrinogen-III synthase